MRLKELLRCYMLPKDLGEIEVSCISRDAKNCKDAALCILQNKYLDPCAAIKNAEECGAVAIICDMELPTTSIPIFRVEDARVAYARMWSAFCGDPQKRMHTYGITGTNGKTSTSYFLTSILKYCGVDTALIGTTGIIVNGERIPFPPEDSGISQMTTPDPEILYPLLAELLKKGIDHAVMEVSSHSLALGKVEPIRFKVGVFTNFSLEHLDFHGNMESYLGAKLKLAALSDKVVYNCDDHALSTAFLNTSAVSYGTDRGYYLGCCVRNNGVSGISYILRYDGAALRIESPVCGDFTLYNTLAAVAAAIEGGATPEAVCDAVAAVRSVPGRLQRVPLDKVKFPFSVLIDYAHTPYALEKLLRCELFASRKGRLITLFGCGGDRDRSKRSEMGRIAEQYSDLVYITSDNPRGEDPMDIIHDILSDIKKSSSIKVIPDRREAIESAFLQCEKDDILLLVGKGHENYTVDKSGRRYFSEIDTVIRAAQRKLKKGTENEL